MPRTLVICCLLYLCVGFDVAAAAAGVNRAPPLLADGLSALQRGDFVRAVRILQQAAQHHRDAQESVAQSRALTLLAQAHQALGQYQLALQNLQTARMLAEAVGDSKQLANVLGHLGNIHIATGPPEAAERLLRRALTLARSLDNAIITAEILNNLGNFWMSQSQFSEALAAYRESGALAARHGQPALEANAWTNAASAARLTGDDTGSKTLLDKAAAQTQALSSAYPKAFGLLNIALAYRELHPRLPEARDALWLRAAELLRETAQFSEANHLLRTASYAWGYLGNLYEQEARHGEALELTRRAVFAAQRVHAPESLYRWQWQTGRLRHALGDTEAAISAYRRAVDTLQSIRHELPIRYGHPQPVFRDTLGAVFFELVDLLLQRSAALQTQPEHRTYLIEARDTVEMLKRAELRDYFRDDCVEKARSNVAQLDVVSPAAVVIYPILLPDRTELLATLPTGLKRFAVPVDAATLTREVRAFRRKLEKRTTREYLPHAQQLYDWLIRPLEPDLGRLSIDTLVFVPDGPLRTIPMAALHDGRQFLIHAYAIAVTPGLSLTDPRPLQRQNAKVLAMGLTEPVQGFPALPNVSAELEAVQRHYPGALLLNQNFLVNRIEQSLREEQFNIVHVASHGQFKRQAEDTFILTFDGKLTIDRLDEFIGLFRFRDDPLELLTLSACQTAAGDDRAALGLAGIAIKAGARSALATLWHIDDQASSQLVSEFYRQLQTPERSRAMALQRAQLRLLESFRYQHPGYWSPFLLINNWL